MMFGLLTRWDDRKTHCTMSDVTTPTNRASELGDRSGDRRNAWAFFWWGSASYLAITTWYVAEIYRSSRHHMIYLLDDAAIHLVVARNLATHFTWGINPGHFESASSSPLWTVILAIFIRPFASFATGIPLVLNVLASLALIAIIGANQRVVRPHWRRPFDVILTVVLVNVVLFLPAMTTLGMEHVLHAAVIVAAVALLLRRLGGGATVDSPRLIYALFAVAECIRLETIFVAIGIFIGLWITRRLASSSERAPARGTISSWGIVLSTALPFGLLAIVNRFLGGSWLPNSLLSRSNSLGATNRYTARYVYLSFTKDRLLLACLVGLIILVGFTIRTGRAYVILAIAVIIAIVLQVLLASVGQFDRYQEYLVALSLLVFLIAGSSLRRDVQERSVQWHLFAVAALTATVMISWQRVELTRKIPHASADVYDQKYLAGVFLEKFYAGVPVASGELGWISWLHHGSFTDLLGLGDYRVLQELRATNGHPPRSFYAHLAHTRGFPVVVMYGVTTGRQTPLHWIYVGQWRLRRQVTTAYRRSFQFWATTPSAVVPLEKELRAYAHDLPADEKMTINRFAELRAQQLASK